MECSVVVWSEIQRIKLGDTVSTNEGITHSLPQSFLIFSSVLLALAHLPPIDLILVQIHSKSINMNSTESFSSFQKRLPSIPSRAEQQLHQTAPSPQSSPRCKSRESEGTASPSLRKLEEENTMLKAELAYTCKIQQKSDILLREVHDAQERLQNAVLKFRKDQQSIEKAFIESTQF